MNVPASFTTEMTRPIVIIDLDGTISDDRHRRHLLPREGDAVPNWDAYHKLCETDPIVNRFIVDDHRAAGDFIVFLTARPEAYLTETSRWIERHFGELPNFALLMRPQGDSRPSPRLKWELFNSRFKISKVAAVYDDRADVLDEFCALGVPFGKLHLIDIGPDYSEAESAAPDRPSPADCLRDGIKLFESRNTEYREAYLAFGDVMAALYPDGITRKGAAQFVELGILIQIVSKVTRMAGSPDGSIHLDSVRDLKVYAAMLESVLGARE